MESGVGHAQKTPLKGLPFESLGEAQAHLDRWEERWADTRIHGTTNGQVAAMFAEEKPVLQPLPLEPFRYYQYGERTVHLVGCVEVEAAYYSAPPGWISRRVAVQWDGQHVRLLHPKTGQLLREHLRQERGRHFGAIILLYRQALELDLKAVVGEGRNFLPSPTDHITLYKTHSLRWLAQIVKKLRWENEFKCQGVSILAEFSALVGELEAAEPVFCTVHSGHRDRRGRVQAHFRNPKLWICCPSSTLWLNSWWQQLMDWRRNGIDIPTSLRQRIFHRRFSEP